MGRHIAPSTSGRSEGQSVPSLAQQRMLKVEQAIVLPPGSDNYAVEVLLLYCFTCSNPNTAFDPAIWTRFEQAYSLK